MAAVQRQLPQACLVGVWAFLMAAADLAHSQPTYANDLSGKPSFVVSEFKPSDPLKIVAYGDMRFTDPSNTSDTNPRVRKYLVDQIARERPDALFVSGDLPFKGGNNADWDVYRAETKSWTDEKLRVYPVIGNHEMIPPGPAARNNYFAEFSEAGFGTRCNWAAFI